MNPDLSRYTTQRADTKLLQELLETLKATRALLTAFIGPDDAIGQYHLHRVSAAIAKAEGGAQ